MLLHLEDALRHDVSIIGHGHHDAAWPHQERTTLVDISSDPENCMFGLVDYLWQIAGNKADRGRQIAHQELGVSQVGDL
ncbi:hypothetical protein [Dankookia sp. P2]|uniref:hypothetical protein n=1 Tax=Dankookia sp. P2 TaxID=3423955 RepID=UPI003D678DB3